MNTDRWMRESLAIVLLTMCSVSRANEDFVPPLDVPISRGAEAAHQVEAASAGYEWRLDTAIFTEISPVTAPEVAIKLPEDQREER